MVMLIQTVMFMAKPNAHTLLGWEIVLCNSN
uniref:Uncharacterized protein n=1 Tax=Rhizophora mucronata TaxID=61149 RepID=A0A2P2PZH8_RHIMU